MTEQDRREIMHCLRVADEGARNAAARADKRGDAEEGFRLRTVAELVASASRRIDDDAPLPVRHPAKSFATGREWLRVVIGGAVQG